MFKLDTPPAGVSSASWHGESSDEPRKGDLWLISWNSEALALAVLTSVQETFVLCWPVTLNDAPVFAPALVAEATPLGVPLVVWPTRETGVGLHMLHRRLGPLLSARTIELIGSAVDSETGEFPLTVAEQTAFGEVAEIESDKMVDLWERICLNVWPGVIRGESPLSADVFREMRVDPSQLADILGVELPLAVSLYRGESVPTEVQLGVLSEVFDVDVEVLLNAGSDAGAQLLVEPGFKESLMALAQTRRMTELEARNLVRSEFALAARSDGENRARLQSTVERLLAEGGENERFPG